MRHGTCFRRRLATHHAGAAPHSAVAELGVVRRFTARLPSIELMKLPFDKIVSFLVGIGIPALVLIVAVYTAGVVGGAALVVALATLGGPLGMLGGIALLGVLVLISKALAEYGFEALFRAVLRGLRNKGATKEEILAKIDTYKISSELRSKLREYVNTLWDDRA